MFWPNCWPRIVRQDLVALLVDGRRVADHCYVVALGITIDGTKGSARLG
jgi:hypothetical protein